ncbi:unnamed protein product [Phytophthora fragariaefolia]|uniref:HECT-type E3 ubiquitin transferase n=1 Tax=Phytophthora fragariaefolia TaxID=1490495 RepID=A0A9W7CHM8_9STRA|nr:unnamed protein product [Phytophthora fragariaefolia]
MFGRVVARPVLRLDGAAVVQAVRARGGAERAADRVPQRRKEWTRKEDVEGRVFWFRDSQYAGGDIVAAAFVAAFEPVPPGRPDDTMNSGQQPSMPKRTELSPNDSLSDEIDDSPSDESDSESEAEIELTTGSSAQVGHIKSRHPAVGSIESRIAVLTRDVSKKNCTLRPASDVEVDALKLPLDVQIGPTPTTMATLAESIALFGKDFPSKYAHFVMAASALLVPADREHLRLNVERVKVFKDSMDTLAIVPLRNLHSVLRIHFIDEKGVDAGGLHREWFVMLNEALVKPMHGLFVCANKSDQTYFLSPCTSTDTLHQQLLHLFAAGRLFGRALLEGSMLCFHLAPPLLKLILGYPLSFADLEDLDPEVYANLRWLLENDGSDTLGLDFTVTVQDGDHYRDVELVPGGSVIAVTDINKSEYVERRWKYLMVESVAPQLQVFLRGLYEVIPRELLLLFDPEEFDFLLCGCKEIDVDDWERNTKYSKELHHHRALKWFWELVREMPDEYRRRLLQFSTGSSRVPLGGFSALTSYDGRLCPFTLKATAFTDAVAVSLLHFTALHSSDDRRLDAALRDAEEGFNVCAVCGFENFKRFKFCTVCGDVIAGDDGSGGGAADKKKTARLSLLPLLKRESGVELVTATHSAHNSRRRLRALRRKEWTRKMDVEGRAYWFREGRWGDTQFAGYVVKFVPTDDRADAAAESIVPPQMGAVAMEDNETAPDRGEQGPQQSLALASVSASVTGANTSVHEEIGSSAATDTPEPEPEQEHSTSDDEGQGSVLQSLLESVEDCIAKLVRYTQEHYTVLDAASDPAVDASNLPVEIDTGRSNCSGDTAGAPASPPLPETMALTIKDFPSKYAHFVTATSALLVPAEREHLRLNVERANVFEDSMESLAVIPLQNVHSVLRINFLEESGVDAGGLHREWFVMLNEMLVDPVRGLFVCTNNSEQTYFLSPCLNENILPDQLLHLYATGRLLGRALLEGSMMCFHLAPPLLKLMLGYPLSFSDLEDFDPEVYANLRWLLENDNVDALGLDFVVTTKDGERYHDVELIPGGSAIPVTDSNKREYVERKWQYLMVESVAPQLQVFLRGLYEIIPRDLLLLFDPEEFNFLLCGSDEIDVDDWERNTKYSEDLHHHRALKWFWELVHEMPNEYRRRLLQFSTGSSRVPLGGFAALTSYDGRLCPFTLKAVSLVGDGFIHSHACFNRLDLPLHVVRDELKAVLYAVLETEHCCCESQLEMELLNSWMHAAADNDVAVLSTLFSRHPTLLDERHPYSGRTALQHASAWDAHDVVDFLLR